MGTPGTPRNRRVRRYESADAGATLRIFEDAVTRTAVLDHGPGQVELWRSAGTRRVPEWDRSRQQQETYAAMVAGEVVGFSGLTVSGHVDMLFVAPDFGRRGVAGELLAFLEERARDRGMNRLTADVSITARPVFERLGFEVEREQRIPIGDETLTNFRMVKQL